LRIFALSLAAALVLGSNGAALAADSSMKPGHAMHAKKTMAAVAVSIKGFAFVPKAVSVAAGTTVTWTNHDSANHTATSDTGVWDSGVIAPGKSYSYTFKTAGSFPYHCKIHKSMKGTVAVGVAKKSAM